VLAVRVLPADLAHLARSPELLVLAGIAWAVVLAATGEALGLSREVGAFVGGASLASTPYREAIGSRLVTVRDFLLLFFFIDLGARLDLSLLGATLGEAILLSAFVLVGNPIIVLVIMGAMGYRKRTSFLAGLTVAQISEFSLILGALGVSVGHLGPEAMGLITTVGLITIALSTYMIIYSGHGSMVAGAVARRVRAPHAVPGIGNRYRRTAEGGRSGARARSVRRRHRAAPAPAEPARDGGRLRSGSAGALARRGHSGRVRGCERSRALRARPARRRELGGQHGTGHRDEPRVAPSSARPELPGKVAVACRTADEGDVLRLEGADVLLRPYADASEQAADALTTALDKLTAVATAAPGLREARLGAASRWAGHRIADVPLRDEFGATVLAVSRGGRSFFNPGPAFQLFPGDRLILSGEPAALDRAIDYLARVDSSDADSDDEEFAVDEVQVGSIPGWAGRSLAALGLPARFGVTVLAVASDEQMRAPAPHRPLSKHDRLVLAGTPDNLRRVRAEGAVS
jgi:K+/H+ antiporter YhaU regulatory subunit KhtT